MKKEKTNICKHCGNEFNLKFDYKEFYDSIKNLMRNLGRTNRIYPSEIQDIIDEFETETKTSDEVEIFGRTDI